jgi:hypothetical protein
MIREFAEIYAKMEEDIEMKFIIFYSFGNNVITYLLFRILIIKSAKNTLITHGNMRADDLLDEVCLFAISVLDDIESNDDYNSSDFTKSITSLCDELLSVYTSHRRNGQDENCLVNKLKNRLEENSTRMRGQSSRKRPATHQSVKEELEEIIHTLGRECESGLDPCISKECY